MSKVQPSELSQTLHSRLKHIHPAQVVVLSFLLVVVVGTLLLMLPISTKSGEGADLITSLFTATSAVCVTGLVVENTLTFWSGFGKTVIISLIQIGGLGLITFMMLFLVLTGQKITLRDRMVIQTAFNQERLSGMIRLLRLAVLGTLLLEGVAGSLLTLRFLSEPGATLSASMAKGFFHAVSAFCNAGFDIIGDNSLSPYVGDWFINLIIMTLIVTGGLGFSVWDDLLSKSKLATKRKSRRLRWFWQNLMLHSKIALTFTAVLIFGGALFFFLAELGNPGTMGSLSWGERILASLFHSVTVRTAGFASINVGELEGSSKLVTILLMLIGGSPGGTAGGVKTVTLGVVWFSIISTVRGSHTINAFGRRIPLIIMLKSLSVLAVFSTIVFGATLILSFSERNSGFQMLDFFFEVASASGTVGLTTGLTPYLSNIGQLVIVMCMLLGRLGPVTVAIALTIRMQASNDNIQFPEEKVLIG